MEGQKSIWTTYEENPKQEIKNEETRIQVLQKFKIIGMIMMATGLVSVAIGIVIVVKGQDATIKAKNPFTSGISITSGVMSFAAGCIGFFLSSTDPATTDMTVKKKQTRMFYTFYILSIVSTSSTSTAVGYTIWGAIACGLEKTNPCGSNTEIEMIMNIIGSIVATILLVCLITVTVMYCRYRRAFYSVSCSSKCGNNPGC